MSERVVVVGGGAAGTAAAWALGKRGIEVTLIEYRAGSSEFGSGIVYGERSQVAELCREFVQELGLWRTWSGEWNVTAQGHILASLGADRALLDLASLSGKRIGVADLGRDDWNAELLSGVLGEQAWARSTHTQFLPVGIQGLRFPHERRIPAADFAELHDDPERQRWLALQLRAHPVDGWLLGPWLGVTENVAGSLSVELGLPVGEAGSRPGGAAGARWKQARDRLFQRIRIVPERARLMRVAAAEYGVELLLQRDEDPSEKMAARAVVLATGGVAAGGILLAGSLTEPHSLGFRLAYEAPIFLELDGELLAGADSGLPLTLQADLHALERIGVIPTEKSNAALSRLVPAGDLVAGQERSVAAAVLSGLSAAEQVIHALE